VALGYVDSHPALESGLVWGKFGLEQELRGVAGSIVLVTSASPPQGDTPLRGEVIVNAARAGARAVLFINDKPGGLVLTGMSNFEGKPSPVSAYITHEVVAQPSAGCSPRSPRSRHHCVTVYSHPVRKPCGFASRQAEGEDCGRRACRLGICSSPSLSRLFHCLVDSSGSTARNLDMGPRLTWAARARQHRRYDQHGHAGRDRPE
jgi:hypothetical protein